MPVCANVSPLSAAETSDLLPTSGCAAELLPLTCSQVHKTQNVKSTGSPYSIAESRVPELIAVLGSQPADSVSHKPGGRLPLLSARPAVTPATLKRAATSFAAW